MEDCKVPIVGSIFRGGMSDWPSEENVRFPPSLQNENVCFGLATAVDNLDLRAVLLRTRCCTAAWRLRAHGSHCDFSLRALAARKSLQSLYHRRRAAAGIAAIHAIRSEDLRGNLQVADKANFCKCSFC